MNVTCHLHVVPMLIRRGATGPLPHTSPCCGASLSTGKLYILHVYTHTHTQFSYVASVWREKNVL